MSSLADALKSVSLKPVDDHSKNKSAPKLDGFLSQEAISTYQNAVLDVNTEEWLDILEDLTFPTAFYPLTFNEATVFIKIYEKLYKDLDVDASKALNWRENIESSTAAILTDLTQRLQKRMQEFLGGEYGFVKTSSRSAKDAPLVQERFRKLYLTELEKHPAEKQSEENVRITCLLQAGFEALKVVTAEDVIDMFVRSERVFQDMLLATECKDRFNEHFVIRKFVHIDVDMEFRGFVFEGKLNAVSQYNYLIHSERLVSLRDEVCERITSFFANEIAPRIEARAPNFVKNYIIDFAICGDKIWVIEINPFLETTDGALFSWNKEREILEGKQGFTFRVIERPKPGSIAMLPRGVKEMLKDADV